MIAGSAAAVLNDRGTLRPDKAAGCNSDDPFEMPVEVTLVGEPRTGGDLSWRHAPSQQPTRNPDTPGHHILVWRESGFGPESPQQRRRVHLRRGRQVLHTHLADEPVIQVAPDHIHRAGRLAGAPAPGMPPEQQVQGLHQNGFHPKNILLRGQQPPGASSLAAT